MKTCTSSPGWKDRGVEGVANVFEYKNYRRKKKFKTAVWVLGRFQDKLGLFHCDNFS